MKIKSAKFIKSAPSLRDCPVFNLPEFALIGRSNVGKSSFINAITGHGSLAKTSNKPGKTRLINLFEINSEFIIADLPGYGYAGVSDKMQAQWQKNLEAYLLGREDIVSLIQFIDSRHPVQKNDLQMAEWIKFHNLPCFIIASKADEVSKNFLKKQISEFEKVLNLPVVPYSKRITAYNSDITKTMEEFIVNYSNSKR